MKPYGLINRIMAFVGKKDYHCYDKNHRKVSSWWEDYSTQSSRRTMKQRIRKAIEKGGNNE